MEFVRRVVVVHVTGSTNDDARRLAAEGAPEGTVVVAGCQRAGRGRLGRAWESPDRLGLYLSVLLRPNEPPEHLGRYAIAAAVAVCAACRELAGDTVVLKWPNDLLAGGCKLGGILSELRHGTGGSELVVGIGLNVEHAAENFSESLSGSATSLRIVRNGASIGREDAAVAVVSSFGAVLARLRAGAWPEVVERFLRYAPQATGRRVRLASGEIGVTNGLDASGALRVETAGGLRLAHASESVTLIEG